MYGEARFRTGDQCHRRSGLSAREWAGVVIRVTATVIAPMAGGDPGRYAVLAAGLAVLTGLLCLVAWAIRLGFVADLLSKPILAGYMAGVALIMIVGQLEKTTGVPVNGPGFFAELASFARGLPQIDVGTLAFAATVLAFLFVVQWRLPRVPGPLLSVLLATAAVVVFGLQRHGITVIGSIPAGLPWPALPVSGDIADLFLPAVGVLVVGFTDTVLTARSFAARTDSDVDANQELLALGAVNIGAGVLRGFPVSSSASRTALSSAAGGRTQLYSLVTLACVLGVLLVASPLLAQFPTAALGAIIVYAAVRLINLSEFRRLAAFRRSEFVLAVATMVGVLVVGILYGVLLAIGLSIAALLARVARPHDAIQGVVAGLAGMHGVDDYPQATLIPGLIVYRYDSPLFFANADDFRRRALATVTRHHGAVAWFVLNVEANVEVDITGLDAMESVRANLADRGIVFALARVKKDLLDDLDAFGLTQKVGTERIFPTPPTAVAAYQDWVEQRRAAVLMPKIPDRGASKLVTTQARIVVSFLSLPQRPGRVIRLSGRYAVRQGVCGTLRRRSRSGRTVRPGSAVGPSAALRAAAGCGTGVRRTRSRRSPGPRRAMCRTS
jgi:high affinity sulfate transporter 1